MKTRQQKTIENYLTALKKLHFRIVSMGDTNFSIYEFIRENKISHIAAMELTKGGILNKDKRGNLKWNTIQPNINMAEELIKRCAKYYSEHRFYKKLNNDKHKTEIEAPKLENITEVSKIEVNPTLFNDKNDSLAIKIIKTFPEYSINEIRESLNNFLK